MCVLIHARGYVRARSRACMFVCRGGGGLRKRLTERENDSKMYENLDGSDRVSRIKHPGL